MSYRVVVPHTEDGIRPEVVIQLLHQGAEMHPLLTPRRARFAYADGLRRLWTGEEDLIVCEADVEPYPGTLHDLQECRHDWCVFPIWTGAKFDTETLGLVRFSARLQRDAPNLMHYVASPVDPRYWVRMGWTRIDPDCSVAVLNGAGRTAGLRPDAPARAFTVPPAGRPTTADSLGLDVRIVRHLRMLALMPHVHQPSPIHLHDYETLDPEVQQPWWALPRDAVDWPTG